MKGLPQRPIGSEFFVCRYCADTRSGIETAVPAGSDGHGASPSTLSTQACRLSAASEVAVTCIPRGVHKSRTVMVWRACRSKLGERS